MGVKLTLLCEGSKGVLGGSPLYVLAPTDVPIVFDEVSKGDENLGRS